MIGRQAGEGALDLAAVQRDDDLLALLAERGEVDTSDPVARLLASLAEDVDDGLAELLVATDPLTTAGATWVSHDVLPQVESDPAPRAWRTAAGAAALAVALAATLSVSGVAAAVTGDPLAPYKAVGNALTWGEDDLPESAAPIAHLNKRLARARAAIAHGEVQGAQSRLDAIRAALAGADLSDGQRAAFERKLDRLAAALGDAATKGKSGEKPAGGRPADKPPAGDPPGQVGKDTAADRGSGTSADTKGTDGAAAGATDGAAEKGDKPAEQPPAKDKPAKAKATQSATAPGAGKGRQKG